MKISGFFIIAFVMTVSYVVITLNHEEAHERGLLYDGCGEIEKRWGSRECIEPGYVMSPEMVYFHSKVEHDYNLAFSIGLALISAIVIFLEVESWILRR